MPLSRLTRAKYDASFTKEGPGLYTLRPITWRAKRWVTQNVDTEPWQWREGAFLLDDTRLAKEIFDAMILEGFIVVER
jgi:hypothetical protein